MSKLIRALLIVSGFGFNMLAQWNPSPSCWTYGTGGNAEIQRIVEIPGKQALLIVGRTQASIIGNKDIVAIWVNNTGTPLWAVNVGTEDNERRVSGLVNLGDTIYCMAIEADTPNNRQPLIVCIDSTGSKKAGLLLYNPINTEEIKPRDLLALPGTDNLLLIAEAKYEPTDKKGILLAVINPYSGIVGKPHIIYMPGGTAEDLIVSRGILVNDSIVALTGRAKNALLGEDAAFLIVAAVSGAVYKSYLYRSNGKAEGVDIELVKAAGALPSAYVLTIRSKHAVSDEDILLVRVDTANIANVRWNVNYTSLSDQKERPAASAYLPGLNQLVVIARQKDNTSLAHRILVLAIDAQTGDTLWTRGIDGIAEDIPRDVIFTSGGLIVLGGFTNSYGAGGKSLYLVALAQDGTLLSSGCCVLDTPGGILFSELYTGNLTVATDTFSLIAVAAGRVVPNTVDTSQTCGSPTPPDWNVPTGCWTLGTDSADFSAAVSKTSNGDLLIAGATAGTPDPDQEMLIMRINSAGSILWSTTVGRQGNDVALAIDECPTGEIAVAGITDSLNTDIYVALLDGAGALLWSRVIAAPGFDTAVAVLCNSSGIYIGGHTNSFGPSFDLLFIKMDMAGNLLTSVTAGTSAGEFMTTMVESDYGLLAGGYRQGAQRDFLLVSVNTSLSSINWAVSWGSPFVNEQISYLEQTLTGEILIGGVVNPGPVGATDFYVALFDPTFMSLSSEIAGGGTQSDVLVLATQRWWDAGFALVGTTNSFGNTSPEFFFVVLSSNMTDTLFTAAYGTASIDTALWAILTGDGGFVAGGFTNATSFPADPSDISITKINAYGQIVTQLNCCQSANHGFVLFPLSSTLQNLSLALTNVSPGISQNARINNAGFWICGNPLPLLPRVFAARVTGSVVRVQVSFPIPDIVYQAHLYRVDLPADTVYVTSFVYPAAVSYELLDTPAVSRVQYLLNVETYDGRSMWVSSSVITLDGSGSQIKIFLLSDGLLGLVNGSGKPIFDIEVKFYTVSGANVTSVHVDVVFPHEPVYVSVPRWVPGGMLFIQVVASSEGLKTLYLKPMSQ